MGIILGLTAALGWGSADFLARYATHQIGTYRTLLFMQLFGLVGLSIYLAGTGEFTRLYNETGWQPWAWALLATLIEIVGALSLYRSFEVGLISLVSPIGASYAALTTVLAIVSGEQLSVMRAIGIVAALLGVILASTNLTLAEAEVEQTIKRKRGFPPGVKLALLAAVCFGVGFWMFGFLVTPQLGGVAPVWLIRLTTPLLLYMVASPLRQSVSIPRGSVWWLIAGVGVLDTVATLANIVGLTTDQVSVVTVVGSLFSAVTVLLAAIFLRDKLAWNQWLGIVIILIGVALVSVR